MESDLPREPFTSDLDKLVNTVFWTSSGFFFIGFLIPIIARVNMNATGTQVGLLTSAIVIGYMISSSFVGIIVDRVKSRKGLILIGSFGRGNAYLLIYTSIIFNYLPFLMIGCFTLGLMAGFFWVPVDTLIAEKSNKDNRSQAYGKKDSANAKGQLVGALIGFSFFLGVSLLTSNPSIIYLPILLYGVANYIGGFKFRKNVDESVKYYSEEELQEFRDQSRNGRNVNFPTKMLIGIIFLFVVVLISNINGNLAKPFLNIYLLENINDNIFIVVMVYFPSGILAALLAPKLGAIVDNFKPSIGIPVASVLGALVTWLLINTTFIWLFAILLLFDLAIVMAAGLMFMNFLSRINLENRGKIMGISAFFTNLGAATGPILGGLVWDSFGPKSPFMLSILVELCLIPLYLIVVHYLLPFLAENYEKKN